jgi:hypothetical protein
MLRLVPLAAAMVLSWTALELRPLYAEPVPATLDLDEGEPRTARALRAAIARHRLDGRVWLGKLRGVGGGRDTLVYVPRTLAPSRTIDVVVYMEGYGSFGDAAMDHRHAASIARLRGNTIYVAPDSPSSAHGEAKARTPYWQAGCAERACPGGHAAPGDFVVFLAELRERIANMLEVEPETLDLRLSLIGFSNGGKGIANAVAQLAAVDFEVDEHPVRIADVIFADGNYAPASLSDTWRVLEARPEAPRLTILVNADPRTDNHRRARAFWARSAGGSADARLRIIPLRAHHHAIGDAAVDYLSSTTTAPPAVSTR